MNKSFHFFYNYSDVVCIKLNGFLVRDFNVSAPEIDMEYQKTEAVFFMRHRLCEWVNKTKKKKKKTHT